MLAERGAAFLDDLSPVCILASVCKAVDVSTRAKCDKSANSPYGASSVDCTVE